MNREIKFRALAKKHGKTYPKDGFRYWTLFEVTPKNIVKETTKQYTGLKDYYEGDIFEGETIFTNCKTRKQLPPEKFIFEIVWYNHGFHCYRKDQDHYFTITYCTRAKKIGNIHDNSDLLK